MNKLTKYIAISGLLLAAANAHASIVTTVGGVALAEQTGTTNNDILNPLQVNTDNIFGGGWEFVGKFFEGSDPAGFTLTGDVISGTITFDASAYDDLLFVQKGGQGQITPDVYVAYLLDDTSVTSVDYVTAFKNSKNDNPGDISHISVYKRGTTQPVPEPSTFALFGAAFAMLGFVSYRSRKS